MRVHGKSQIHNALIYQIIRES